LASVSILIHVTTRLRKNLALEFFPRILGDKAILMFAA